MSAPTPSEKTRLLTRLRSLKRRQKQEKRRNFKLRQLPRHEQVLVDGVDVISDSDEEVMTHANLIFAKYGVAPPEPVALLEDDEHADDSKQHSTALRWKRAFRRLLCVS